METAAKETTAKSPLTLSPSKGPSKPLTLSSSKGPATILIAGGGTGGHIYPALALAAALGEARPDLRCVFVGTLYGLERDIVPAAHYEIEYLAVRGLVGKRPLAAAAALARLAWSLVQSFFLLRRYRPLAVAGVGGYASGPAVAMAHFCGVPTTILESNAYPGLTNRLLSRWADEIAVAFPRANETLARPGNVIGNPVRREFFAIPAKEHPGTRLLVFGGSQGSRFLNDLMIETVPKLGALGLQIVHQTGKSDHARVLAAYRGAGTAEVQVVPYLERIFEEYATADLVVSRAGALTVSELNAAGRPAVLIPFAAATHNHQEENALYQESAGAARLLREKDASGASLAALVSELFSQPAALLAMARRSRALAQPQSARRLAEMVLAAASKRVGQSAGGH